MKRSAIIPYMVIHDVPKNVTSHFAMNIIGAWRHKHTHIDRVVDKTLVCSQLCRADSLYMWLPMMRFKPIISLYTYVTRAQPLMHEIAPAVQCWAVPYPPIITNQILKDQAHNSIKYYILLRILNSLICYKTITIFNQTFTLFLSFPSNHGYKGNTSSVEIIIPKLFVDNDNIIHYIIIIIAETVERFT